MYDFEERRVSRHNVLSSLRSDFRSCFPRHSVYLWAERFCPIFLLHDKHFIADRDVSMSCMLAFIRDVSMSCMLAFIRDIRSAVAQLVECRTRNREIPGSNPRCYRFEVWAFSLTSQRLSRLSCINEYLAIDSGGNVSE